MAHGIDPPVQTVQAAGLDAPAHGVFADTFRT
jgi:hypothetical protein